MSAARRYVGERLREIRTAAGLTQEEVAAAARSVGQHWARSVVSGLEGGRKAISLETLLVLPEVLARAGCPRPSVADLLPPESRAAAPVAGFADCEQKAAARFGVPQEVIRTVALTLWGRSLKVERDARTAGAPPRTMQALRGHTTRQLHEEMLPLIEDWKAAQ